MQYALDRERKSVNLVTYIHPRLMLFFGSGCQPEFSSGSHNKKRFNVHIAPRGVSIRHGLHARNVDCGGKMSATIFDARLHRQLTTLGTRFRSVYSSRIDGAPIQGLRIRINPEETFVHVTGESRTKCLARVFPQELTDHGFRQVLYDSRISRSGRTCKGLLPGFRRWRWKAVFARARGAHARHAVLCGGARGGCRGNDNIRPLPHTVAALPDGTLAWTGSRTRIIL